MKAKTPKLQLTAEERSLFRRNKLVLAEIVLHTPAQLTERTGIALERAKELVALASFQTIPSIGPKLAWDLVQLGYFSLQDVREKEGAALFDELEAHCGYWIDSCVEDQLRCVVHYARFPNNDKQWWDFTDERKSSRVKYGFPPTRPTKSGFE